MNGGGALSDDMALRGLHYKRMRLRGDQRMLSRQAARQREDIAGLRVQLERMEAELADTEANIARKQSEVEALSHTIRLVYGQDIDDGETRQTFPKRHIGQWGALTRTVLDLLRQWGKADADQLAEGAAQSLALSFASENDWRLFRCQMGRTLKNMYHRNLLTRHHAPDSNQPGIWSLRG